MRPASILAAGLLGSALFAAPALALPTSGLVAGDIMTRVVEGPHRHLRNTGRTDHPYRVHRRHNTHMHGHPNARNPEREGYAQQLGDTTNGPRH